MMDKKSAVLIGAADQDTATDERTDDVIMVHPTDQHYNLIDKDAYTSNELMIRRSFQG